MVKRTDIELMAPVGSRESLMAAIQAGADSVYLGIENLNMRSRSSNNFTQADLKEIAATARNAGVKTYLTVNTEIYDGEEAQMRSIVDCAVGAGVTAVIASDISVILYARSVGMPVHISTQCNISNFAAAKYYSRWADVVVLARECTLDQVKAIHQKILAEGVRGPAGEPLKIEMFAHGALCMAVSGKCYLSLMTMGASANRGACLQICRRKYLVADTETGQQLEVDGKYIMSPKDLKTIGFLDRMVDAGVRVLKIEGRARSADYVKTVTRCYDQALRAIEDGSYAARRAEWDTELAKVFNRGFWDGYYQGQPMGEWTQGHGNQATEKKVLLGTVTNYFARAGVGEFRLEQESVGVGDRLLVTGPTTGAEEFEVREMRVQIKKSGADGYGEEMIPAQKVSKGNVISIPSPVKIRRGDKFYKILPSNLIQDNQ